MLSLTKMTQLLQHLDNMKDYQVRVIKEKEELDIKIKALQKFIESKDFVDIGKLNEQISLREQLKVMNQYSEILKTRINRY